MQMNVTISGYVLFKNLYVNSFVQFAGEDLGNPNKFSELLETSEPERSFKKKVRVGLSAVICKAWSIKVIFAKSAISTNRKYA